MSAENLRVGLIGCGDISRAHFKSYDAVGIDVAAICDTDQGRMAAKAKQFNCESAERYTDYTEMVRRDDLDLVTVATPVALHAPMTIAALRAGKHVACEKPSTLSIAENRQIIEEADKAQKKVLFFSSRQRWGASVLARQYIADGDLGDIYRVNVQYFRSRGRPGVDIIKDATWFANRKLAGGGIMMDMGQYFIDNVMNLTGWPELKSVSATTWQGFPHELPANVPYDVEEHATIFARTAGATYTFDFANISNHKPVTRIMILGTRGGIVMGSDAYFSYCTEKGGPWQQMEHTTGWKDGTGGNDHIYGDLARAIRGEDVAVGTSPREALYITELTEMAYRSADEGREIARSEL